MRARRVNEERFTRGGNTYKKLKIGKHRYGSLQDFWDWLEPQYDPEDAATLIIYDYEDEVPPEFLPLVKNWDEIYNEDLEFQKNTAEYGNISMDTDDVEYDGNVDLLVITDKWSKDWNKANGF